MKTLKGAIEDLAEALADATNAAQALSSAKHPATKHSLTFVVESCLTRLADELAETISAARSAIPRLLEEPEKKAGVLRLPGFGWRHDSRGLS